MAPNARRGFEIVSLTATAAGPDVVGDGDGDDATRAEREEDDDDTAAAGRDDVARLCPRLDAPPAAPAVADAGAEDVGDAAAMLSAATHASQVRTGSPFSTLANERRAWGE